MNRRRLSLWALLATCLAAWSPNALAVITDVTASVQGSLTDDNTVTIRWSGVSRTQRPNALITSFFGELIASDGQAIALVNQPLVEPRTPADAAVTTFTVTETLRLSATLAESLRLSGALSVRYRRGFDDGDLTGSGEGPQGGLPSATVTIPISVRAADDLAVERLDLRFDDNRRIAIRPSGARHRAVARVLTDGSGLVQARWELLYPNAAGGRPVTLDLQRRLLTAGQPLVLTSPELPTPYSGEFRLRLTIQTLAGATTTDELRYAVIDGPQRSAGGSVAALDASARSEGTDIVVSWRHRQPAIVAYRIEVLPPRVGFSQATESGFDIDEPGSPGRIETLPLPSLTETAQRPVSAQLVPTSAIGQQSVVLSPRQIAQLDQRKGFRWRVLGFSADGSLRSISPIQRLPALPLQSSGDSQP